jgi:hypothetical protein
VILAPAALAKTTDQSDLWWVPTESGWGIQFVQQETTIFATLFVYGPDGKPTWYAATLNHVGSLAWSGDLYTTTGPWFGTVPFDPATVTRTSVGTMSLSMPFINQGTLTYTVNGVAVVKQIQRQTLVTQSFSGAYTGTLSQQGSGLPPCNPARDTSGAPAAFQVTQNSAAMTVVAQTSADTCTFSGTYSQAGHFGRNAGTYNCTSGDSGTFTIFEMAVSFYDFRARTVLNSQTGCTLKGYIGGLRQPPPAQ